LLLACLLTATGCALGIFVEFFALQGDIGRMNTVFKFYLQVWVMWSLVSAAALAWAIDRIFAPRPTPRVMRNELGVMSGPRAPLLYDQPAYTGYGDGDAGVWTDFAPASPTTTPSTTGADRSSLITRHSSLPWWQWAWLGVAGALLLAALAFPLGATPARVADRFQPLPPTLDGMAYMQYATVTDASSEVAAANPGGATIRAFNDYDAIRWLQDNVQGSPVILEASIPEYRWGARVAKYTGLPAVLGWRWHQAQQRGTYAPQVDQRLRDVQLMFSDPSPDRVLPLLAKYQVRYIYVGDLERAYYPAAGIAKFGQMPDTLRPVYDRNGVTIYEVTRSLP
jgi:uncharacterized membrane protein